MRLAGQTAVVTGAAKGMGRAISLRLAGEGADLALAARETAPLEAVAAEARDLGRRTLVVSADVRDEAQVQAMVARAVETFGRIDVLVNCAGTTGPVETPVQELRVGDWDDLLAINLRGTFLVCRYALPHMLEAGGGVIVNTTSVSGIVGNPWNAAYAASKGGVLMLTKALAAEYRHRGVRVNGIAPGMVATDLSAGFTDFFAQEDIDLSEFGRGQPVRAASPDEIAATFAFIASADAAYMSGAIVVLDGGATS